MHRHPSRKAAVPLAPPDPSFACQIDTVQRLALAEVAMVAAMSVDASAAATTGRPNPMPRAFAVVMTRNV
jgi:hypothetical protein